MARGGIKTKAGEKLDDRSIENVIYLLEKEGNSITKKEACQLLNITYNTTRLGKIIENYLDNKARYARLKAKKRGKPASDSEIRNIVEDYMRGEPMSEIAISVFRSPAFVKRVLEQHNVPMRSSSTNYFHPELLPDEVLSENFEPGEIVWSARYNTTAIVDKFIQVDNEHGNVYRIWILGSSARYASQPWYEMGKLEHLKNLGVKLHG